MATKPYPPTFLNVLKSKRIRVNRSFSDFFDIKSSEFAAVSLLSRIHVDDIGSLERVISAGGGALSVRVGVLKNEWHTFDVEIKEKDGDVAISGWLQGDFDLLRQPALAGAAEEGASLQYRLETMAKIVEAKNLGMKCSILLVDWETECVFMGVGPSLPNDYNEMTSKLPIGPMVGSCGTASYWNVPVVVENIQEDPLWEGLREAAANAGVAACWSFPITSTTGEVLGAMALYNEVPAWPERHHIDGLEVAARMVGLAIEHERLEGHIRRSAKMEAVGSLAGGIAHDFNNILAAILGNAELAIEYLETSASHDAKLGRALDNIVKSSLNASELCVQLLGFSGKPGSASEVLDCNVLVKEICELTRVTITKKITISYNLESGRVPINGDKSQLGQVVMNLLTNAAESIRQNEGKISISTTSRYYSLEDLQAIENPSELKSGDYVCLSIVDSGCGMSKITQRKIFEPFFTTKPTGRGLGLAAVHGIVKGHKGALSVNSIEGHGTEFSLLLPLLAVSSTVRAGTQVGSAGVLSANVLVVDDDEMVVDVLKTSLISAGHDVLVATDGQEGIDVFRESAGGIDCVLLDLNMPKLDGEEVYRELCLIDPNVKVILCSGFAEQTVIDRFKGATLAGVLKKPFKIDTLLEKVAEVTS